MFSLPNTDVQRVSRLCFTDDANSRADGGRNRSRCAKINFHRWVGACQKPNLTYIFHGYTFHSFIQHVVFISSVIIIQTFPFFFFFLTTISVFNRRRLFYSTLPKSTFLECNRAVVLEQIYREQYELNQSEMRLRPVYDT